jgi:hypothetical protein
MASVWSVKSYEEIVKNSHDIIDTLEELEKLEEEGESEVQNPGGIQEPEEIKTENGYDEVLSYRGYKCGIRPYKSYIGVLADIWRIGSDRHTTISGKEYDEVENRFYSIVDGLLGKEQDMGIKDEGWEGYCGYTCDMYHEEGSIGLTGAIFDEKGEDSGWVHAETPLELKQKFKREVKRLMRWRRKEQVTSTMTWTGSFGAGQGKWENGRFYETCEYKSFEIPDFSIDDDEDDDSGFGL